MSAEARNDLIWFAARRGWVDEPRARARLGGRLPTPARLIELGLLTRGQITDLLDASTIRRAPGSEPAVGAEAIAEAESDPSRQFGAYVRLRELGRGGFGAVWLAWDPRLRRRVALKVLMGHDPEEIERFKREARLAAALTHPNIAAVYEVGEAGSEHFIAMQYVEGETLANLRLDVRGAPGMPGALDVIRDAARAVAFAHRAQVIHRDLKPQNIMRDADGRIFVLDFGLAKSTRPDSSITASDVIMGTPSYMSPEQAQGRPVTPASDVYSLGATLYHLVTGVPPFGAATPIDTLREVIDKEPEPPSRINPRCDRDLDTIVLKCLEKEPARRYAGADALADDVERALGGEAISAHPPSRWYRLRKRVAKRRAVVVSTGLGLAAVAIVLAVTLPMLGSAKRRRIEQLQENADVALLGALTARRGGSLEAMRAFVGPLEKTCAEAEREAPELPHPHYHLGRLRRAMMEFDEALLQQETALRKDPDFGPSLYERAVLLTQAHRARREVLERRGAAADDARLLDRIHEDARRLLAAGGVDEARRLVAEAMLRPDRAGALLEQAVALDPTLEEAYEMLAETADPERAVEWSARGHAADRGYLPHLMNRARARRARGDAVFRAGDDPRPRYEEAATDYGAVLDLQPDSMEALLGRADVRVRAAEYAALHGLAADVPLDDYDAAVERHPLSPEPLSRRAAARVLIGDFERAIGDADAALALDPSHVDAYLARASARVKQGIRLRETDPIALGIHDYDAALRVSPNAAVALARRGSAWAHWGRFKGRGDEAGFFLEAERDLDAAVNVDDAFAEAYSERGWYRTLRELWEGAAADFERAAELDPGSTPAFRELWDRAKREAGS